MFDELRGLNPQERATLARAKQVGYLAKTPDVGFQADETWYAWCESHGLPYVSIGTRGTVNVVICNLDSVRLLYPSYSPVLAPTPRLRRRLDQLVIRCKAHGDYGGSYTYLRNIPARQAEQVAQELIAIWQEARMYKVTSSLWDVEMSEQEIA